MAIAFDGRNPTGFTAIPNGCLYAPLIRVTDGGVPVADGTPVYVDLYEFIPDPDPPTPSLHIHVGIGLTVRGGNGWAWAAGGGFESWIFGPSVHATLNSSDPIHNPSDPDDPSVRDEHLWESIGSFAVGGTCPGTSPYNGAGPVLTATPGVGEVQLDWTEPASDDAGFPYTHWVVYRGTSPGSGNVIAVTTDPEYLDETPAPGVTYYYHVVGVTDIIAIPVDPLEVPVSDDIFHSLDSNEESAEVAAVPLAVSIYLSVPLKAPS